MIRWCAMVTPERTETEVGRETRALAPTQARLKRGFDFAGAMFGLLLTFWLIGLAWLAATVDTWANSFFLQGRAGRERRRFRVIKLWTMHFDPSVNTNVTTARDARIAVTGRFLRRAKLDDEPQLINVLKGDMSFVGPRPDVPGFADALEGDDRRIVSICPGIAGPAVVKYRDEEALLAAAEKPERYTATRCSDRTRCGSNVSRFNSACFGKIWPAFGERFSNESLALLDSRQRIWEGLR